MAPINTAVPKSKAFPARVRAFGAAQPAANLTPVLKRMGMRQPKLPSKPMLTLTADSPTQPGGSFVMMQGDLVWNFHDGSLFLKTGANGTVRYDAPADGDYAVAVTFGDYLAWLRLTFDSIVADAIAPLPPEYATFVTYAALLLDEKKGTKSFRIDCLSDCNFYRLDIYKL